MVRILASHLSVYGRKIKRRKGLSFHCSGAGILSESRGVFHIHFCDTGMVCPLAKMYTLGSGFIPSAKSCGDSLSRNESGAVTALCGCMEASVTDGCLEAANSLWKESCRRGDVMRSKFHPKRQARKKRFLLRLTGTGYFDMYAYEKFHRMERCSLHSDRCGTANRI